MDTKTRKALNRMPKFMMPEIERIETMDDLVYQTRIEIDCAEGDGVDPRWTEGMFRLALKYLQTLEAA